MISKNDLATVRQMGNVGVNQKKFGVDECQMGKHHVVRGIIMNLSGLVHRPSHYGSLHARSRYLNRKEGMLKAGLVPEVKS